MARRRPRRRQRLKPLWMVVGLHILSLGVALLLYAIPHHVIPKQDEALNRVSSRNAVSAMNDAAQPTPEISASPMASIPPLGLEATTPEPTVSPTPEPQDATGSFRIKFADKFTSGEPQITENQYISANINVTFSTHRYGNSNVNIADVYVADISCIANGFGTGTYGRGSSYAEMPVEIARRYGSIATLSGDYCGGRSEGVVLRDGVLYRDKKISRDVGVLYWDGTMKVFSPGEFDTDTEINNGAYQVWNFGPMLLDQNGQTMTSFNSDVKPRNPRSIIGYFEPGHYCLIFVEGRSKESSGLTLSECSEMVAAMGLKAAYNLDGGQTAALVKAGALYGTPYKGGRHVSDAIIILDRAQEGA